MESFKHDLVETGGLVEAEVVVSMFLVGLTLLYCVVTEDGRGTKGPLKFDR